MQKFLLILALLFAINVQTGQAKTDSKENIIKGLVVDANTKEPLVGATVLVVEQKSGKKTVTSKGTITGVDGTFYFTVWSNKSILVNVSYNGYESQFISISQDGDFNTILLKSKGLDVDEVVVMGYAQTTKARTVGSISTVKGAILKNSPTDNPISALQGRLPGVLITQSSGIPGSQVNIQIRGRGTFNEGGTSTAPLIIVDGMPFSNTSVSTLNRGLISGVDPMSALNPADIERIDVLKDADATAIYGSRGANGVVLITTKRGEAGKTKATLSVDKGFSVVPRQLEFLNTKEFLAIRRAAFAADGREPTIENAPDLLLWDQELDSDWYDVILGNTAESLNVQGSLSGGNKNTQFILSGGYNDIKSVVLDNDSDNYLRLNTRLNILHRSSDERFTMNTSLSYSSVLSDNHGSYPGLYLNIMPNRPRYDDKGNPYWLPDGDNSTSSPMHSQYARSKNNIGTFMGVMTIGYELIDNLIIKTDMGYTRTNGFEEVKYTKNYYNPHYDRSYWNRADSGTSYKDQFNFEPQLTYSNKHGDGEVTALAGMTMQSIYNQSQNVSLSGFPLESLMNNASSAETIRYVETGSDEYRFASLFGRVGYAWKDRYFFNGVFRRDGSSRFYSDNQFGNFWSVGAAWVFSREDFLKDNSGIFSYGKIRASYGMTGNDGVGNYQYLATYGSSRNMYNGAQGFYPNQLENKTFSWEENKKFEVGLELAFFKRRISIDAGYYDNRSGNQLVEYPLPYMTGFDYYRANLDALILNRGFEMSINSVNINTNGFRWSTNFNITVPENKLLKFPGLEHSSYRTQYAIGRPLSTQLVYEFDKIDPETGIPLMVDQNNDGKIDRANDRVFKGNEEPVYYGGIGNTLSYKGISLDFFFQFSSQPVVTGYQARVWEPLGTPYNMPKAFAEDYWTPENRDASRPGLTSSMDTDIAQAVGSYYSRSDAVFSSASFIRLKNVALSYNIPQRLTERMNIGSMRVYVNAQNLWTYTKYLGWDPETRGEQVPPLQTVVFGVSIAL